MILTAFRAKIRVMKASRLTPWFLGAALLTVHCGQEGRAQSTRGPGVVRVATYNLQWFSEDADPDRIRNVRAVLNGLDADVVGFQEIQSVRALRQVLGAEWDIAMVDDADDQQETAVAVRKPLVLAGFEPVFPSPSLDEYFPGARDILRATVQTPEGKALFVHVVHMKSRRGGRRTTDPARLTACGLLAAFLRSKTCLLYTSRTCEGQRPTLRDRSGMGGDRHGERGNGDTVA